MQSFRVLSVLVVASMSAAIDARPAAAEVYRPWCAQYYGRDGGGGTNCGFTSFEQCMLTARGAGAFCVQNPWYLAYGDGGKTDAPARSRRSRR
jgi:hypothetical protein